MAALPEIRKQKARKLSLGVGVRGELQRDGVVFTERIENKDFQLITFIIVNEINADGLLET